MELWIRSQDKEKLIKIDYLRIIENEEDKEFPFYINAGYDFMAAYKTKERALEVLDEIEKTTINIGLPWNEQNKEIAIGRHIIFNMVTQIAIYEMPEK